MSEEVRIIVQRVRIDEWEKQEKMMVPHSTIDTCRTCQEPVWLSPEGNVFVYQDCPDAEIICVECHIALEVERRKRGDEQRIETRTVPGASVPPPPGLVKQFTAAIEQHIKRETGEE